MRKAKPWEVLYTEGHRYPRSRRTGGKKKEKSELELLKEENEKLKIELELAELRAANAELRRKINEKQFPYNPYWSLTLRKDGDSNNVLC